jgi:hypothetical protein
MHWIDSREKYSGMAGVYICGLIPEVRGSLCEIVMKVNGNVD